MSWIPDAYTRLYGSFYVFKNTEFMIETCKVPEVFACYLGTLRALGLPLSGDPP